MAKKTKIGGNQNRFVEIEKQKTVILMHFKNSPLRVLRSRYTKLSIAINYVNNRTKN